MEEILKKLILITLFTRVISDGVCQASARFCMPVADHTGLIPTVNRYGWMTPKHSLISKSFMDFALQLDEGQVLDIGTAYGFVPLDLLDKSDTLKVTANDLDSRHLEVLRQAVPGKCKNRLILKEGHFPNYVDFPDHSFDAILASRVFHFLTGEELEVGAKKIFAWLKPGGRIYVLANSPYRGNFQTHFPQYEKRKLMEKYPGVIFDFSQIPETIAPHLPKFVHLLDLDVIKSLFLEASFEIEFAEYLHLDVGVIAIKPNY